jgi:pantetheine-phosphate adenylyltransferase
MRKGINMRKAMYPGTFDPVTIGHLDVIKRASTLFDHVYVVIMENKNKRVTFSAQERLDMILQIIQPFDNVSAMIGNGLTVDYAKHIGANILIRGIRAVMDYEFELQQATANMTLSPDIETVFLLTRPEYSFMSSSAVKEIALNHGDISSFVPTPVLDMVKNKYK